MKRQITLVSALLAGSALAQTTATTTIGEVTLTKPVAAPAPAELSDPVEAAPAQETADQSTAETAPAADETGEVTKEVEEADTEEADTQETLETAPAQPVQPVTPPSSAATPAPAQTTATPAVRPVTPPAAQPATTSAPAPATPAQAQPAQVAPQAQTAPKAATPAAPKSAPAVTTSQPAMPTATAAKATPTQAPSDLPAGWRHLSGDIFGSKLAALPAGSKVQVAIEAVNRATGLHTPHLLVDFSAESLPTEYYINYNPGRMNTAKYDYVIQAKVFDADGDMLYMSDARQPLPKDVAAKLKIDMRF